MSEDYFKGPVFARPDQKQVKTCVEMDADDLARAAKVNEEVTALQAQGAELQKKAEAAHQSFWEAMYEKHGLEPSATYCVDRTYEPLGKVYIAMIPPQAAGGRG